MFANNDTVTTFGPAQNLSPTTGNLILPTPVIAVSGSNVYVAWQDITQGNGDVLFRGSGAPPQIPDVAVMALNVSRTFAYSGVTANNLTVSVTASNPGQVTEAFTVSVKASNSTDTNTNTKVNIFIANNQTVNNLAPGASQVLQFSWNPAGSLGNNLGNYMITAYALTMPGEANLSNNALACPSLAGCGWSVPFKAKLKGDVNADCKVDIVDLATVGSTYGKTIGQPGYNAAADFNNSDTINIVDLVLVAGSYGQSVTPCPY